MAWSSRVSKSTGETEGGFRPHPGGDSVLPMDPFSSKSDFVVVTEFVFPVFWQAQRVPVFLISGKIPAVTGRQFRVHFQHGVRGFLGSFLLAGNNFFPVRHRTITISVVRSSPTEVSIT